MKVIVGNCDESKELPSAPATIILACRYCNYWRYSRSLCLCCQVKEHSWKHGRVPEKLNSFFSMFYQEYLITSRTHTDTRTHPHGHTDIMNSRLSWREFEVDSDPFSSFNPCIISYVIASENINNIQINEWKEKVSRIGIVDGTAIHRYPDYWTVW